MRFARLVRRLASGVMCGVAHPPASSPQTARLGASWNVTPKALIQQTETTQVRTSQRRVWDAYAQGTQTRDLTWRIGLGLSNLAPLDAFSPTVTRNAAFITTTNSINKGLWNWMLWAERRF